MVSCGTSVMIPFVLTPSGSCNGKRNRRKMEKQEYCKNPYGPYGQFSKVQSGKMGPDPGSFELLKGYLRLISNVSGT